MVGPMLRIGTGFYEDCSMAPKTVFIKHPCPLGLSAIPMVAHIVLERGSPAAYRLLSLSLRWLQTFDTPLEAPWINGWRDERDVDATSTRPRREPSLFRRMYLFAKSLGSPSLETA